MTKTPDRDRDGRLQKLSEEALRETVEVFLECDQVGSVAAAKLGMQPSTFRSRLQRARRRGFLEPRLQDVIRMEARKKREREQLGWNELMPEKSLDELLAVRRSYQIGVLKPLTEKDIFDRCKSAIPGFNPNFKQFREWLNDKEIQSPGDKPS